MIKRTFIILLVLLAVNRYGLSQGKNVIDSLKLELTKVEKVKKIDLYIDLARLYWEISLDSSFYFSKLAVDIAHEIGDNSLLGDAYNTYGGTYLVSENYTDAIRNLKIAKDYREKSSNKLKVTYTLNNLGIVYRNFNMYTEAISAFREAKTLNKGLNDLENEAILTFRLAETYNLINDNTNALENAIASANLYTQLNDNIGLASVYLLIGTLHWHQGNNRQALNYYTRANNIYILESDQGGMLMTTNSIGIIYDELGDNETAIRYYQQSLKISQETNSLSGQSMALNNIGFLYGKIKNYDLALEYYEQSVKISKQLNDSSSIKNTYNNIAWVYYHNNNLNESFNSVQKAITYKQKATDLLYIAESHEILSKIYFDRGNYREAYLHLDKLKTINDSLFKTRNSEQFAEMQVRFETERKEQEIELLRKNEEIRTLEFKRQKNISYLWGFASLLLLAFGVFIYFNLNDKRKVNRALEKNNEELEETNNKLKLSEEHLKKLNATKDRFFSIIAHDLKNPFNALIGFSEVLFKHFDSYSTAKQKEILEIILETSNNLYRLLDNLLQWSLSQIGTIPFNPSFFPLAPLTQQEVNLLKPLAQNKNINIDIRVENSIMVYADTNLVGVVLRNLINNAIKFCNEDDKVTITANENQNNVVISVIDTGIGIAEDQLDKLFNLETSHSSKGTANEEGTGLGLLLCKEFVEKNGGTIEASSIINKGSSFTFTLPANKGYNSKKASD